MVHVPLSCVLCLRLSISVKERNILADKQLAVTRKPHAKHTQCFGLGSSFPESQQHLILKSRKTLNSNNTEEVTF